MMPLGALEKGGVEFNDPSFFLDAIFQKGGGTLPPNSYKPSQDLQETTL